ncbi:ABC transporter permease [Alkalihalobacillus sp. TS-13]|uniref:ABC transporter permease n=1 Tax=Alkalihalobacillus sp. TS-13 TaxID=2842455 RepID=UPI001C879C30|nr:ABC transporter permease [Alkalihalobacillus sp. TS-13]
MNVIRLMQTEMIKQKRNLLWLFILVIPTGTTAAMFLDMFIRYEDYLFPKAQEQGISSWEVLVNENHNVLSWGLFLSVFIAIISMFINQYETKIDNWKKLLSLPVTRSQVFLSKYLTIVIFGFALILLNTAGLFIVGKIIGFPEVFPITMFTKYVGYQFAAILGVAAIQNGLSTFVKNPIMPVVFAFVGMVVAGVFLVKDTGLSSYYPYLYTYMAGNLPDFDPAIVLYGGLGSGVILLIFGMLLFQKKDII